jgi:hypothetical protein
MLATETASGPNQTLQQSAAAFRVSGFQRLSSGRRY